MKIIEVKKLPSGIALNLGALRSSSKRSVAVDALPEVTYVRPSVTIDAKRVKAYAKVCGFTEAHGVPMLVPHMVGSCPLSRFMRAVRARQSSRRSDAVFIRAWRKRQRQCAAKLRNLRLRWKSKSAADAWRAGPGCPSPTAH